MVLDLEPEVEALLVEHVAASQLDHLLFPLDSLQDLVQADGAQADLMLDALVDHHLRPDGVDVAVHQGLVQRTQLGVQLPVGRHLRTIVVVLLAERHANDAGQEGTGREQQPHHHVVLTALPVHRLLQLLEQAQCEQRILALPLVWLGRHHLRRLVEREPVCHLRVVE